jgi:hypothetical protein
LAECSDVDLASFAASALLHRIRFQVGVVCDRVRPVFVVDAEGNRHFSSLDAMNKCGLVTATAPNDFVSSNWSFYISSETVVELLSAEFSFVVCKKAKAPLFDLCVC